MKPICALLCLCASLLAIDDTLAQECFKRYYPQIASIEDNRVLLKDGRAFVWDDGLTKTYDEMLSNPDMNDAFTYVYPLQGKVLESNLDTSRVRQNEFYKAIYGSSRQEVAEHIIKVPWFPQVFHNSYVYVSGFNGVEEAFRRVMARLSDLPQAYYQFLSDQDAFYWRNIADSSNLSPHSFGIALDINTKFSRYWLWDKKERNQYQNENQIPMEIIHAFEAEGFVWGGRWWHYDTMHFEYRPEIICYARNFKG